MFKLESKKLPNTRYFFTYSEAKRHARYLGLGPRSYKIKGASEA